MHSETRQNLPPPTTLQLEVDGKNILVDSHNPRCVKYGITLLGLRTCITVLINQAANSNTMQQFLENELKLLWHSLPGISPGNFPKKLLVVNEQRQKCPRPIAMINGVAPRTPCLLTNLSCSSPPISASALLTVGRRNCVTNIDSSLTALCRKRFRRTRTI